MNKTSTDLLNLLKVPVVKYIELCINFLGLENLNDAHDLMRLLRFILNPIPPFLYTRLFILVPFKLIIYAEERRETVVHNANYKNSLHLRFDGFNLYPYEDVVPTKQCVAD